MEKCNVNINTITRKGGITMEGTTKMMTSEMQGEFTQHTWHGGRQGDLDGGTWHGGRQGDLDGGTWHGGRQGDLDGGTWHGGRQGDLDGGTWHSSASNDCTATPRDGPRSEDEGSLITVQEVDKPLSNTEKHVKKFEEM